MMKPTFSLLLIFLSLASAFQGEISELLKNTERNIYKNIGFISQLDKNKGKIFIGQREMVHKVETEESDLSKDFEIDEELVIPKEDILGPYSLINFRQSKGEIIVPCFGMWWPVGGSDVVYEYSEGDYGKKRKRKAKQQKKTSKAKKRKRT